MASLDAGDDIEANVCQIQCVEKGKETAIPLNGDGSQMPHEDPAIVELATRGGVKRLNPKVDEDPYDKARQEQAKSAYGKRLLVKPREKVQTKGSDAKRPLVKPKEKVPMKGFD
ncbi:hypothetical protein L7F22_064711 [Adiantum nelumboides]|nr:hypothetical protein [Adiantum nelumboides]